jgi:hypothetical protein
MMSGFCFCFLDFTFFIGISPYRSLGRIANWEGVEETIGHRTHGWDSAGDF